MVSKSKDKEKDKSKVENSIKLDFIFYPKKLGLVKTKILQITTTPLLNCAETFIRARTKRATTRQTRHGTIRPRAS